MAAKPIYAAGLDAGSRKTRAGDLCSGKGPAAIVGAAAVESQGWLKGRIADQRRRHRHHPGSAARGRSDRRRLRGIGGGGHGRPHGARRQRRAAWWNSGTCAKIEQRDVNRVVDRASHVQLHEDRMVLQLFPQDFVVDDHPGHRDPRKMLASRLEINVHLVTTSVQEHNALVGAVNQAHLAVEETVFEALAACYASVLPEERREGIAVIDIGAESTELVVYYGDAMHLASTVRVCGDHFTRDLAQGLCISFEDAELVKLEYGSRAGRNSAGNAMVELPTPENREPRARAAPLHQPDSGSARQRAVPVRAHRTGARGHGPRADRRRLPHRRGGAACPIFAMWRSACCMCQARFGLPVASRIGRTR